MTRYWKRGSPAEVNAGLLVNSPSVVMDCVVVL